MKVRPKIITVFGSSRPREGDWQYSTAHALGSELAAKGFIVCSGGYGGVMEAASRGAKEAGGETLGITASFFGSHPNGWIDKEIRMKSWRDRLFELVKRGRGYVVCPGGTGTLAELAVVWELLNKNVVRARPLVVLGDFWQPVINRVREVERGHTSPWGEQEKSLVHIASTPTEAAAYLVAYLAAARAAKGAPSTRSRQLKAPSTFSF
ncbi:MAG: LOG family protein [Candidatus Acidiferrales bacterium]